MLSKTPSHGGEGRRRRGGAVTAVTVVTAVTDGHPSVGRRSHASPHTTRTYVPTSVTNSTTSSPPRHAIPNSQKSESVPLCHHPLIDHPSAEVAAVAALRTTPEYHLHIMPYRITSQALVYIYDMICKISRLFLFNYKALAVIFRTTTTY